MCIRRLQQEHAGRKPTRPQVVMKDNGELTHSPSEVLIRWHQHFSRLLNVESVFSEEVLESITALPHFAELDTAPSEEELVIKCTLQTEEWQSWGQNRHSISAGQLWWCTSLRETTSADAGCMERRQSSG